MTRHDGRDGVLVDELRMAVATQQHAEIIEPGHHALQFDAVHQKDGERNFGFADVIEEGVLQVLCAIGCHGRCSVLCTAGPFPAGRFLMRFSYRPFRPGRLQTRPNRPRLLLDGAAQTVASPSWERLEGLPEAAAPTPAVAR